MILGIAVLSCAFVSGTCHPSADPGVTSYAVRVTAPAGSTVRLRAGDVPAGWIASFCTLRVCSPFSVRLTMRTGVSAIQLSLVRTSGTATFRKPRVTGSIVS